MGQQLGSLDMAQSLAIKTEPWRGQYLTSSPRYVNELSFHSQIDTSNPPQVSPPLYSDTFTSPQSNTSPSTATNQSRSLSQQLLKTRPHLNYQPPTLVSSANPINHTPDPNFSSKFRFPNILSPRFIPDPLVIPTNHNLN
jgi:hypothetical protein